MEFKKKKPVSSKPMLFRVFTRPKLRLKTKFDTNVKGGRNEYFQFSLLIFIGWFGALWNIFPRVMPDLASALD